MSEQQTVQTFQDQKVIVDIAIDSWRFARLFVKALNKLDAGEAGRYLSQYEYFKERLNTNLAMGGLKLVDLAGQSYDAGMPVKVLNMEDFTSSDALLIDHMIEPVVMGNDGLIREGTAMVGKVKS